ncbi:hypothetical protein BC832DRAFT_553155 [Gaertneriomyces semiglobifer]|nr:hypothetical protein BC832DRAFT_553155 [Gaertneriomyces semiglobifer]
MWCMQYFFFLFLIPFPRESPVFLISFLLSMFITHKPCLYCSLVIFGLLASSCHYYAPTDDDDEKRCWVDLNARAFNESNSVGTAFDLVQAFIR